MRSKTLRWVWVPLLSILGCGFDAGAPAASPVAAVAHTPEGALSEADARPCPDGPYPAYWPDRSNQPPPGWDGPVFRLSQDFPQALPKPEPLPWEEIDPFNAGTPEERARRAEAYLRAVYDYVLEGNVKGGDPELDFTLCDNPVRTWYHVPWMHSDPRKGREFVHGLTQELQVHPRKLGPRQAEWEQSWAVGFYNAPGAYVIGQIFAGGDPRFPTRDLRFPSGTVVGKVLTTTASLEEVPWLRGSPEWRANIHTDPRCDKGEPCDRAIQTVRFFQFDVAVTDERSPTGWVFGTMMYRGDQEALPTEPDPWRRVVPVGLAWGNDPTRMPRSGRAVSDPSSLVQGVHFLSYLPDSLAGRDLGCAGRANGPADNPISSCLSCHMTASVPRVVDGKPSQPAILHREQCCDKAIAEKYFRNLPAGHRFDPEYVSSDYSLQVSEALYQFLSQKRLEERMALGLASEEERELVPLRR